MGLSQNYFATAPCCIKHTFKYATGDTWYLEGMCMRDGE